MNDRPEQSHPPTVQGRIPKSHGSGLDEYHSVAETIGGIPSLRWKDNFYQAAFVSIGAVAGAVSGWLFANDLIMVLIGTVIGLVLSVVLSGIVIMVLGWRRASGRR